LIDNDELAVLRRQQLKVVAHRLSPNHPVWW
jgi:hypothetical protein